MVLRVILNVDNFPKWLFLKLWIHFIINTSLKTAKIKNSCAFCDLRNNATAFRGVAPEHLEIFWRGDCKTILATIEIFSTP